MSFLPIIAAIFLICSAAAFGLHKRQRWAWFAGWVFLFFAATAMSYFALPLLLYQTPPLQNRRPVQIATMPLPVRKDAMPQPVDGKYTDAQLDWFVRKALAYYNDEGDGNAAHSKRPYLSEPIDKSQSIRHEVSRDGQVVKVLLPTGRLKWTVIDLDVHTGEVIDESFMSIVP